jgi:hypothetical protein
MKSFRFHADMFEQVFEQSELTPCIVITFQVMAVSGVSPRNPDTVGAVPESGEDELGAHTSRAGHPNDPDVGSVLEATDACQVSCTVTAPVAKEGGDFRLPIVH